MASDSERCWMELVPVAAPTAVITNLPSLFKWAVYNPLALILLIISPTVSPASTLRVNAFFPFWSIVYDPAWFANTVSSVKPPTPPWSALEPVNPVAAVKEPEPFDTNDIGSLDGSIVLPEPVLLSEPAPERVPFLSPIATSALSSGPSNRKLPTFVVTLIWPFVILQSNV